jgi:hypothetical protein
MALEGPGPRFSILGPANKTTLQDEYSKFFHPKLTSVDEKWHDCPIRSKFPSKILPQDTSMNLKSTLEAYVQRSRGKWDMMDKV